MKIIAEDKSTLEFAIAQAEVQKELQSFTTKPDVVSNFVCLVRTFTGNYCIAT